MTVEALWPLPDPDLGDGSEFGEPDSNDGTPGAVAGSGLVTPPRGLRVALRLALAPVQRLVVGARGGDWAVIPSPNYSSRKGAKVRLIIFHSAEGALTRSALGAFFGRSSVGASSHVGIDDTGITRYVPDAYSAWTARNANPVAVQAELCAFAAWTRAQWLAHPGMLENAAKWAAQMSIDHGVPLTRVRNAETVRGSGVCVHHDITVGWKVGSHVDCGTQFPVDEVIARARQIVSGVSIVDQDEQELEAMKVPNPYSGQDEDASVAIGYAEQRISDRVTGNVLTYLKSDEFLNAVAARATKNLLDAPMDDVATWDAANKTVVSGKTNVFYALKRAAEASIVRWRGEA